MKRKIIPIRVTDKEHADFYALAKKEGMPLAILIRVLLTRRIEERKQKAVA